MRNWMKALVAVLAVVLGVAAWADDRGQMTREERRLRNEARRIDREAAMANGEERVLARMSSDLGLSAETLKQQKQESGLSYGNLFIANSLAQSSGKSFSEILAARESGKGWGQIAKENNVKLGEVVSAAKRNASASEAERRNAERRAEREAAARDRGRPADRTMGRAPERGSSAGAQGRPPQAPPRSRRP